MRQIKRRIRATLLGVCFLFTFVSVTAFASNVQEITEEAEGTKDTILLNDEKFEIVFIESEDEELIYTGNPIEPKIEVYPLGEAVEPTEPAEPTEAVEMTEAIDSEERKPLVEGTDYTVAYENNVNAGYATVTVTGTGEYSGSISAEFEISAKSIKNAKLTIDNKEFVYNGKAKKPVEKLTLDGVVLKKGVDYDVTYTGEKEVGTASVTVTAKGNYTGTKAVNYTIGLKKPSISSVSNYDQVKITWKKISGASGYEVYRSTSKKGKYSKIATIKSGKTVSYTDKKVKFNKTFYYKVRAYRTVDKKKIYSSWSSVNTSKIKPGTPKISKISRSSTTSLKVVWKKISGASGYEVYRSTSEKGKYSKIATIKSGSTVSYTDKGRGCGKSYYYKVKAYRTVSSKKYYGSYSEVKKQNTVPGKVSWDSSNISYSAKSITLKWKKVPEATGYCIYRSTDKYKGYKKIKVLNKNTTLSWKDTGLKKGKVYYYRICSYKNMGKYPVYGEYSSAYTKKTAGWRYSTYDGKKVKLYYNHSGKLVKDVSSIIGKQKSYQIKINKRMNTVTVYAKDGKNGYIIPVKSFICSTGAATPLGTYKTPQKIRWHELDGPSYGQWCTRIYSGFLFHSVWYYKPKNTTLSVVQYNRLGTQASHGCVRLTAGDAKWIFDNCELGTTVKIYNSNKPGPLGKPKAHKLASWHTWDPTDPNMKSKCKAKGCH